MSFLRSLLRSYRTMGWLGRFVIAASLIAVFNFADIFAKTMEAANRSGTRTVDGYVITVCYFGPPPAFYPRLLVCASLLVAAVGVLKRTLPRRLIAIGGLTGALTVYIYWWVASYRLFRNFSDAGIDFLNNVEIRQVAYLYQGTWSDISLAILIAVCLVLSVDRLPMRRSARSVVNWLEI